MKKETSQKLNTKGTSIKYSKEQESKIKKFEEEILKAVKKVT